MNLTTNDLIQIIGIIVSTITSVTAILISTKTLKQNSKMIEESSRPYLTVYANFTQLNKPMVYLVMKNFGNSSATITKFNCDTNLKDFSYPTNIIPFGEICGYTLSPGQKLVYPISICDKTKTRIPNITINLSYKNLTKEYSEKIYIKFEPFLNEVPIRFNNTKNQERIISYTLQDIAERML